MTNTEYDETAIAEMGKASERSSTKVSWLIPDLSRAASPLGPGPGEALVERIKVPFEGYGREGQIG